MTTNKLGAALLTLVFTAAAAPAVPGEQSTASAGKEAAIVGSWLVDVDQSTSGLPPFRSLHTYHAGGTFTETTDLLGQLNDGPSHGAWKYRGGRHHLTFQLFVFDADKLPAGVVRVRCTVRVRGGDLAGDCAVDFFDPAGNLSLDIDQAQFVGQRIAVVPR